MTYSKKKTIREALPTSQYLDTIGQLDKLETQDKLLMALLCFTGARRGEVLGFKWEDVNFDQSLIHVKRSITFTSNQPIEGTPKSASGYRSIPIEAQLIAILKPHQSTGFIVGNSATPMTECTYKRAWQRIKRTIDLHGATAHILRHNYLTMLASTGIDIKTVQAIGGHADISTTMNRYVHSRTEKGKEAGQLLERAFQYAN